MSTATFTHTIRLDNVIIRMCLLNKYIHRERLLWLLIVIIFLSVKSLVHAFILFIFHWGLDGLSHHMPSHTDRLTSAIALDFVVVVLIC